MFELDDSRFSQLYLISPPRTTGYFQNISRWGMLIIPEKDLLLNDQISEQNSNDSKSLKT